MSSIKTLLNLPTKPNCCSIELKGGKFGPDYIQGGCIKNEEKCLMMENRRPDAFC